MHIVGIAFGYAVDVRSYFLFKVRNNCLGKCLRQCLLRTIETKRAIGLVFQPVAYESESFAVGRP
jgi:hypothetical protein